MDVFFFCWNPWFFFLYFVSIRLFLQSWKITELLANLFGMIFDIIFFHVFPFAKIFLYIIRKIASAFLRIARIRLKSQSVCRNSNHKHTHTNTFANTHILLWNFELNWMKEVTQQTDCLIVFSLWTLEPNVKTVSDTHHQIGAFVFNQK